MLIDSIRSGGSKFLKWILPSKKYPVTNMVKRAVVVQCSVVSASLQP